MATRSDAAFYRLFLQDVCEECSITPLLGDVEGVEVTVRENENGRFLFLLNHNDAFAEVYIEETCSDLLTDETFFEGTRIKMEPKGVKILKISR